MLRYAGLFAGVLFVLALVWILWPARIDPEYWDEPTPPPMTGVLEPRGRLAAAQDIRAVIDVQGLLDDRRGGVFLNGCDGELLHRPAGGELRRIAQLPAPRLIGLDWMADGRIAAAGGDGLYAIDPESGAFERLSQGAPSRPLGFVNDVAVGPDGLIYFTDSTVRWPRPGNAPAYLNDMLENCPHGLLLCFDPVTRRTVVVAERLYYPNGVEISPEGDYLLIAETYRYQLRRIWLSGPEAGSIEMFAENLPGLPDGLAMGEDGRLIVGLATPRIDAMRWMHRNPWQLAMLTKLLEPIWLGGDGRFGRRGFLLEMDTNGAITDSYHPADDRFGVISTVDVTAQGDILFGSLSRPVYGRLERPS